MMPNSNIDPRAPRPVAPTEKSPQETTVPIQCGALVMPRRKATDSEVHAYQFIKDELRLLGWDVRNPERADAGQVWTQHEALHNPAINESLKGRVPENVVKVTSKVLWIFEAKPAHKELEQALKEA